MVTSLVPAFGLRCAAILAAVSLPLDAALGQRDTRGAGEVRAARLTQNAALAGRLIDRVATFWTADVVVTSSRGQILRGKDAYREALAGDSSMIYVRRPHRIDVAADWPLAWEEGVWSGRRGPDGPEVIGGRYAAQWHRIDGRWLIRSEVFVALTCSGDPCGWPVVRP